MKQIPTIVLCLRLGGDFHFSDVNTLAMNIHKRVSKDVRVICLADNITQPFELMNVRLIPTFNKEWTGWWTKMNLFDPRMEEYRPFLYMDLDTAVVGDLTDILPPPVGFRNQFICLGGFFNPDSTNGLQSGLMWFPQKSPQVQKVWDQWIKNPKGFALSFQNRGGDQGFIRSVLGQSDTYWQKFTNRICSFKENPTSGWIQRLPEHISVVCFHGFPRIPQAAKRIQWVAEYCAGQKLEKFPEDCTIIIPYKKDRGWLQDAINSVPIKCQLLVSQGEGNWPQNFNKVLDQATGLYIKYLHDDDMLTRNCVEDSIFAIESLGVDFIHGRAMELHENGKRLEYRPRLKTFTLADLKRENIIHSATTMYKRGIFEKIGGFDETLTNSEEYEFNLRCLKNGFKIGYCDSLLAFYRHHPNQQSQLLKHDLVPTSKWIASKF